MKDVLVTVVKQEGTCGAGHSVGDSWRCGGKTVDGICGAAYATLYPLLCALASGGSFSWADSSGGLAIACPDADNPVVFRLQVHP